MKSAVRSRALIITVALLAAAALATIPFAASAAPSPTEVAVYPADQGNRVLTDRMVFGGTTGYLHQPDGTTTYVWTTYGTGVSEVVTDPLPPSINVFLAGADRMAYFATTGSLVEIDFADDTSRTFAIPTADLVMGVDDNRVLVRTGAAPETASVLTFAADGSMTSAPIGLPSDLKTVFQRTQPVGSPPSQVLEFTTASVTGIQFALVDLSTGAVKPIPGVAPPDTLALISADHVAMYSAISPTTVQLYSRSALVAGTATAPPSVTMPSPLALSNVALVGDHIARRGTALVTPDPVTDIAPDGTSGTALANTQTSTSMTANFVPTTDGAVLVPGGSAPTDWAVYRLTAGSGGAISATAVQSLHSLSNAGVLISNGLVRHVDALPDLGVRREFMVFGHDPANPSGSGDPLPPPFGIELPAPVMTCAPGKSCVRLFDDGEAAAFVTGSKQIGFVSTGLSSLSINVPSTSVSLVGGSPDGLILNGTNPAQQFIVVDNQALTGHAITPAAISFSTLWSGLGNGAIRATDGLIGATNVSTGVRLPTISTGATCPLKDLQATSRWLYWSCGGIQRSGVIDLQTNARISVPSGAAMLGDGYIVRHFADGSLVLNDFHSDSLGASVTLAHVPAGPVADDRGIVYSVDPTGGDVAYVDAANSVHVIDPGVPRSPVAIVEMPTGTGFVGVGNTGTGFPWNPVINLNRAVSSWTVEIRKVSSGAVVFTQTGGSGVSVTPFWNGRLASGAPAVSGQYTFSLSVTPIGESSPVTVPIPAGSNRVVVACGQAPFRSYDCDGAAALLAVKSNSEAHWFNATPTGSLADNGYTENWVWGTSGASQVSALVPFGDYNGDGLNDLIVRDGTGVLWAYDGIGQSYFGANTKQRIGSGWNAYNTLLSPGDLTGDGIADLVGRDSSGNLYLYKSSGKSSFAARVLVGSGWSGYKTVIGAGDLNGDGLGDLLAIDTAGKLWFMPGRVNGIGSRTQVGTGWSSFNAVIGAGDVNDDGHNDLVARTSAGVLLLYPGRGNGTFSTGTQIGTGFGAYARLF